mgnify:CR=1 FL=1
MEIPIDLNVVLMVCGSHRHIITCYSLLTDYMPMVVVVNSFGYTYLHTYM